MQSKTETTDYSVWESTPHNLDMFGKEDLILGKNGMTDIHSYLSRAFRYKQLFFLTITAIVTVTVTVQST